MPRYNVAGDYGPQGDQSIVLEIDADNPAHAKNLFCEQVELEYPSEWGRMGRSNVSVVYEIKPKEVVVSKWWVKYKHGLGFRVDAATFFDAVAAAEKHVAENNLDRDSVLSVARMDYWGS